MEKILEFIAFMKFAMTLYAQFVEIKSIIAKNRFEEKLLAAVAEAKKEALEEHERLKAGNPEALGDDTDRMLRG